MEGLDRIRRHLVTPLQFLPAATRTRMIGANHWKLWQELEVGLPANALNALKLLGVAVDKSDLPMLQRTFASIHQFELSIE